MVSSVLSGNRNFEGRISPLVSANYLASPPLVVAYAIAGTVLINLKTEPLGFDKDEKPIFLKDIWPSNKEISKIMKKVIKPEMYINQYSSVFTGGEDWSKVLSEGELTYNWNEDSTYVQNPPYFENMKLKPDKILKDAPAGEYLLERQVRPNEFNSYGSRRGNHQVMMRGTFANIRLANLMVPGHSGGFTKHFPSNEIMSVYDAAMLYAEENIPLIIFGGKEYGTGSSRDWAAKGTRLLGIKAVIAQSFERIHRSNLIGMGVLPLECLNDISHETLNLEGSETFNLNFLEEKFSPNMKMKLNIVFANKKELKLTTFIDIF